MKIILFAVSIVSLLVSPSFAELPETKPAEILGTWRVLDYITRKPRYVVKISENKGQFEGHIVKVLNGGMEIRDGICADCEGLLKGTSLLGLRIIYSIKRDGSTYEDGYLLDPMSGNVYDCRAWIKNDGAKLLVRGYNGLFFRTHTWLRIY